MKSRRHNIVFKVHARASQREMASGALSDRWLTVRMGAGRRQTGSRTPVFMLQTKASGPKRVVVCTDGVSIYTSPEFIGGQLAYLENDATGVHTRTFDISKERLLLPNGDAVQLSATQAGDAEKDTAAQGAALFSLVRTHAAEVQQWTLDVNARIGAINSLVQQLSAQLYHGNAQL